MAKTIRVSVLVLLLACPVYAGEMQNDVKQALPASDATQTASAEDWMPSDGPEGFTETVLSLLESVLSLL